MYFYFFAKKGNKKAGLCRVPQTLLLSLSEFFIVNNDIMNICIVSGQCIGCCKDVGGQSVKWDPNCDNGGVGCNAGGQGTRCRFCGFGQFPNC